MSEDQRDESPGGATTAIATASAVPTSRDRWLLAAACVAAVVTVAVLSGPNGGGTTWAEIDKYHSYFDGAVSTGSLVALPYPFLSLAPMAVAWAGGAAAWMVFACAVPRRDRGPARPPRVGARPARHGGLLVPRVCRRDRPGGAHPGSRRRCPY